MARVGKKQLNVHIDEDSYERLRKFTARHGCSITAFLEAVARSVDPDEERPTRWLSEVLKSARQIDGERRSRKPT